MMDLTSEQMEKLMAPFKDESPELNNLLRASFKVAHGYGYIQGVEESRDVIQKFLGRKN